ncbi:UDP-glucose 4-epimerase [Staphylococcus cohnii]
MRAVSIVLDNEVTNGQIYNLATGKQISLLEIFDKFKLVYNKSIDYQFAESRSGDIKHSCADIKGLEALGFKPKYDIVSGLTEYIKYSNIDKIN